MMVTEYRVCMVGTIISEFIQYTETGTSLLTYTMSNVSYVNQLPTLAYLML